MDEVEMKMLSLRARYQEIVEQAARIGLDLLGAIDPLAAGCSTGTSCCAGDDRVLDARDLVVRNDLAEALRSVRKESR